MNVYKSQRVNVLEHLQNGSTITPLEALENYGCLRLAAVIFDLKNDGHNIKTNLVKKGKKSFASYSLCKGQVNMYWPQVQLLLNLRHKKEI